MGLRSNKSAAVKSPLAKTPLRSSKVTPVSPGTSDMEKVQLQIAKMENVISGLVIRFDSLKQENEELRADLKVKDAAIAKVQDFCEKWKPYMDEKMVEIEKYVRKSVDSKIAEHFGAKEAITILDSKVASMQNQIHIFETSLCKDLNIEGELASLKDDQRENVGQFELIKRRVEKVESDTQELQAKVGTPYLDAVNRSVGPLPPAAINPALGRTVNTAPKDLHGTKCVIRAPRGMFQGRSPAVRAQSFNTTISANLVLKGGHFNRPEAISMNRLGGKEGAAHERWVATFNSSSDVSKLFEYKKQLKDICPQVFVEPFLTKEEIGHRNLIWVGAKQFINQQAAPNAWRFQWVENVKGLINGPAGARRYVIIDGESAKVTDGGNVRIVGYKERVEAAGRTE